MEVDQVRELVSMDESPILEFKRQWYWEPGSPAELVGIQWGEFYKDIIALCNGYVGYSGKQRHLIIGFCEKTLGVHGLDFSTPPLNDLRSLRRKIVERMERLVEIPPMTIQLCRVDLDEGAVLVFNISPSNHLTVLKSELQTKTRTLDAGMVLVRKGQDADSVRAASPSEISALTEEFERLRRTVSASPTPPLKMKERSIEKTVQLYIEKNRSFSMDLGYPVSIRDWSEGIIFELFRISEQLGGSKYFLYIHENASQSKTHGYIRKLKYIEAGVPVIVLTEKPSLKDATKRKDNISQIFGAKHVFFIDEFGLNYLYGECIQDFESYNLPVFVESVIDDLVDGDNSALSVLKNWYQSIAQPLMVVTGYGGIGKSTLAKQFLDIIGSEDRKIGLLFIDSNDIIDRLMRVTRAGKNIDDLYDFYTAQIQADQVDAKNFSKELLKLSVDNGSLLIVLDGIDEVIAKLGPRFDVSRFIQSILEGYSNNLERGKVLITCRDNFWRELNGNESVQAITLRPFDLTLATDFFSQAFGQNQFKVDRAIEMADKFAIREPGSQGNRSVYIPYVLDMIAYLIKHKQEFGGDSVKLATETKILNPSAIPNDFLVGSVCEREIKKLGNCSVDDQINFLIDFAVDSPSGHVSIYDVKTLFERTTSVAIADEFVEKLKDHPLLSFANNSLNFRYDFFYQYFKSLYVARYFIEKDVNSLNPVFSEVLGSYVGFDNDFTRSLCNRLTYGDEITLFAIETIDSLRITLNNSNDSDREVARLAISAVTSLMLSLRRMENHSLDVENSTALMHELFGSNGELNGLCVVGPYTSERAKVIFDFRNLIVRGAYFEQFEHFWDCLMDERTRFIQSTFVALEPRTGVKPKIYPDAFDRSCDISDIADLIDRRNREVANVVDELKDQLLQFFRLFYKQGNFYPKRQEDVRARVYTGRFLPILLKQKVVIDYHDPKKGALKQYKVSDEFRPIVKLFEQGGVSLEFERVVELFK